jgi:hypothetical protein
MPSQELENAEIQILRPPSPRQEELPSIVLEDPDTTILEIPPPGKETASALDRIRASTDVEDTSDESEDNNPLGTNAKRGRVQSLDSARKRIQNKELIYLNSQTLSTEQEETVNAAAELLTKEQKEQVQCRQDKVASQNEASNEPGTSLNKGKTTDPREWGNSGLAYEEMDIAIQKAILDAYKRG